MRVSRVAGIVALWACLGAACGRAPTSPSETGVPSSGGGAGSGASSTAAAVAAVNNTITSVFAKAVSDALAGLLDLLIRMGPGSSMVLPGATLTAPCAGGGTISSTHEVTPSLSNFTVVTSVKSVMTLGFADCRSADATLDGTLRMTMTHDFATGFSPGPRTTLMEGLVGFTINGVQGSVRYDCAITVDTLYRTVTGTGTTRWEYPIGTTAPGPGCGP